MTNIELIKTMETLRMLPEEFSKRMYDEHRQRRSSMSIENLRDYGFVTKVREEEFDMEVNSRVILMCDGTIVTQSQFREIPYVEWEKYKEDHGGVDSHYHLHPITITLKRYIYRANLDAIRAEIQKRIDDLMAAL